MKWIEDAPDFAPAQAPICSERSKRQSIRKLLLVPPPPRAADGIQKTSETASQEEEPPVQAYLHLQLLFGEWLQRKHITQLTDSFCGLGKEMPLKQVVWNGLSSEEPPKMTMEDAGRMFLAGARRKSSARRHELLRIPPIKTELQSGEITTASTDAQHSDETLVDQLFHSPVGLEVPQITFENADIRTDKFHADVGTYITVSGWHKSASSLLLGLLLGLTVAHSKELIRVWRR